MRSKKGITIMGVIVTFILLFLSMWIITTIWMKFFAKAEGVAAENLCRNFNALKYWSDEFAEDKSFGLFSTKKGRACQVIEKVIATDLYDQNTKGVKEEISYMAARCWWMWLEGLQENMFKKSLGGDERCFQCYTFRIKKGKDIEKRKGFKNKALTASVLAGWSFVAGLLQSHPQRLNNLLQIPKATREFPDPINAKGMSTFHHDEDEATYRGLGTRSSMKDRQRMAQVFLAKSTSPDTCLDKGLLNKAVSQVRAIRSWQRGYSPL